ncbi:hypothetical protein [Chamaesiphon sp.]|uniref:hypothetical protein n=1 Tax=Chamaesiphon sp. TaxID=2814140 RepID=UPI003594551A
MTETKSQIPVCERQEGETDKAWYAYTIYQNIGAGRSVDAAYSEYIESTKGVKPDNAGNRRGHSISSASFKEWQTRFNWAERVRIHDADSRSSLVEKLAERSVDSVYEAIEKDMQIVADINKAVRANSINALAITQRLMSRLTKALDIKDMKQLQAEIDGIKVVASALLELRKIDKISIEVEGALAVSHNRIYAIGEMLAVHEKNMLDIDSND